MTKQEALKEFREFILPTVIKQYGHNDRIAKAEAWSNFTDLLSKNGDITRHQDETWLNPF